MIKVLLISVTTLKERSILQANTDEKILNLAIEEFQELELKDALGEAEYNRIQQVMYDKIQNTTPVPAADVELMTYIKPVMIYGALMYSISPLHQKQGNKGTQIDKELNAEVGSPGAARADYAFKLEGYKRDLLKYIRKKNEATTQPVNCESIQDTTAQFTGMFLPDETTDVEQWFKDAYYKTAGRGRIV